MFEHMEFWYKGTILIEGKFRNILNFCEAFLGSETNYKMNNIIKAKTKKTRLKKWGSEFDFSDRVSEEIEKDIIESLAEIEENKINQNCMTCISFDFESLQNFPLEFFKYVSEKFNLKILNTGYFFNSENNDEFHCYKITQNEVITKILNEKMSKQFLERPIRLKNII